LRERLPFNPAFPNGTSGHRYFIYFRKTGITVKLQALNILWLFLNDPKRLEEGIRRSW